MTKNYILTESDEKTSNTLNKSQQTVVYAPEIPIYLDLSKDSFKVTYLVNVYDHFGLDLPDVDPKVHSLYYALAGFRAWFLLQHLHNFQPFITKFSYEKTFTGSLK